MTLTRRAFFQTSALTGSLLALAEGGEIVCADPEKVPSLKSPFLQGNFGPVHEEITAENLKVIGKLPPELDGMFVRNGPNPQFPPLGNYHWFDGDGMLHGVRVQDGKASYRNRYVRTAGWKEEHAAGKALYGGLMDPPTKNFRAGELPFKNTANTALVWHDGRLLALWEGGAPHAVRLPELETVGPYTFAGKLKHPFTAHPKLDRATGEMLFFGYSMMQKPYVHFSVVNAQGELMGTVPIDLPRPVMMHDFAVTQRYAIFMDLPEVFSMARAMRGEPPLKFEPQFGARFGILPRDGKSKEVRWFSASPCYIFHTLNAYEDADEVVLLACRMKEFPEVQLGMSSKPADSKRSQAFAPLLYRWRFNLQTGKTKEEPLDEVASEFPRIHEGHMGRQTRFGYTAKEGGDMFDGLIKYDLAKGGSEHHTHGKGRIGGEGGFVPRPDAKAEDDGWLVTYVYDQATGKSEMVVVDARAFREPPVARVLIPTRVPYGFHGTWITGEILAKQV